jgi:gliding motility-associated-like protein
MDAIGGSGVGFEYNWYQNGNPIDSGSTITVTPSTSPTIYTGIASDDCTTPLDSITVTVDWPGIVIPSFSRFPLEDSCYSTTPITFTNTSSPTSIIQSSEWSVSNGNSGSGNTYSSEFNTSGCNNVTLTMTTIHGCIVDTTYSCFVNPHSYPFADFDMTPPITDLFNTEIDFENFSSGNDPLTYVWNFNSGLPNDSTSEENPTFNYPDDEPNNYSAVLTVTDINGCTASTTGNIVINGIYLFYLPTSFTPNGDGLNEEFRAFGDGIDLSNYSMYIYNRWGELMFQTDNIGNGWDGSYKGKKANVGVYVWKIVAKEENGTIIHDHFGQITISK